jgi:hypothetical protein
MEIFHDLVAISQKKIPSVVLTKHLTKDYLAEDVTKLYSIL